MKCKILLTSLMTLLVIFSCNKDEEDGNTWVFVDGEWKYEYVTKDAKFINETDEPFINQVFDWINYPAEARLNGIEGEVVVQYEITEIGNVENIIAIEDIGYGCGDEVIDALKLTTEGISFYPAEIDGIPVRVRLEISAVFDIP